MRDTLCKHLCCPDCRSDLVLEPTERDGDPSERARRHPAELVLPAELSQVCQDDGDDEGGFQALA